MFASLDVLLDSVVLLKFMVVLFALSASWLYAQNEEFIKQHVIKSHGAPVAGLSWSPDDSLLLSCGHEDCSDILVFNTQVGEHFFVP